jgi:hypothetical protein
MPDYTVDHTNKDTGVLPKGVCHHDAIIIMMRTTINLPDDVYEAARTLSIYQRVSLGAAVAELVRRGLGSNPGVNLETAFPTFDIRPDARKITLEETLAAEEDN